MVVSSLHFNFVSCIQNLDLKKPATQRHQLVYSQNSPTKTYSLQPNTRKAAGQKDGQHGDSNTLLQSTPHKHAPHTCKDRVGSLVPPLLGQNKMPQPTLPSPRAVQESLSRKLVLSSLSGDNKGPPSQMQLQWKLHGEAEHPLQPKSNEASFFLPLKWCQTKEAQWRVRTLETAQQSQDKPIIPQPVNQQRP